MAKLIKCKSCGNMVSKDASTCPQCGGKVKKSHGCLLVIVIFVFFITCLSMFSGGSSGPSSERKETDPFQVEVFSESGAIIFAQNFLEKYGSNIKYTTAAKVDKAETSNPGKTKKSGDFWTVSQEFTEKNAFGVDLKHSYCAIVEFCSGKGYRMAMLMIDNSVVYPSK